MILNLYVLYVLYSRSGVATNMVNIVGFFFLADTSSRLMAAPSVSVAPVAATLCSLDLGYFELRFGYFGADMGVLELLGYFAIIFNCLEFCRYRIFCFLFGTKMLIIENNLMKL